MIKEVGTYVGDQKMDRTIPLPFTPACVVVLQSGNVTVIQGDQPYKMGRSVKLAENGFQVHSNKCNTLGVRYVYLAW